MNYQKINEVFITTDLTIFKGIEGNRDIKESHVKQLERSIKTNGMLMEPILVNEEMQIINGHHRVLAAINVKSHVYFIIVKGYKLNEVQILNAISKKWSREDFLYSYCKLEYPEYLRFKKFRDDFKMFNFSVCERILLLRSSRKQEKISGSNVSMHYFEDGELKIHNEKQSRIIAGQFLDLRPFFEGFNKRAFVSAMIGIFQHENYSHDEFINKLKMRGAPRLDFCQNAEQYKLLVEDIFNFKRRTKVNLRY